MTLSRLSHGKFTIVDRVIIARRPEADFAALIGKHEITRLDAGFVCPT